MTLDLDPDVRRRAARHPGAAALVIAFALLLALHCAGAAAQKLTPLPSLPQRVNDNVSLFTDEDDTALASLVSRYRTQEGVDIMVLTIGSTGSETIDEYTGRLLQSWTAGHPGSDKVVLIVIARDNRPDSNRVSILATPKLPLSDTDGRRIVEEDILPHFRVLEYGPGVTAGIQRVKSVLAGEPLPAIVEPTAPAPRPRGHLMAIAAIAAVALVVCALIAFGVRQLRSRRMVYLTGARPLNRSFVPMLVGRIVGRRPPSPDDDGGNGFGGGYGASRSPIGAGDFSGSGASGTW